MAGGYGRFRLHARSGLRRGEAISASGAAAVFADRLLQVRLKCGELVAFGGRQAGSSDYQVDEHFHLLELRRGVQPD
jgi:hypothetical protein